VAPEGEVPPEVEEGLKMRAVGQGVLQEVGRQIVAEAGEDEVVDDLHGRTKPGQARTTESHRQSSRQGPILFDNTIKSNSDAGNVNDKSS